VTDELISTHENTFLHSKSETASGWIWSYKGQRSQKVRYKLA